MQIILDADADFVCLQEVINVTRDIILSNEAILERYPYYTLNDLRGYGEMILTKHPCYFY